jgi:hypothetical protein
LKPLREHYRIIALSTLEPTHTCALAFFHATTKSPPRASWRTFLRGLPPLLRHLLIHPTILHRRLFLHRRQDRPWRYRQSCRL